MEKQFQEVFPELRIEGGMAELLDTVEVSRVSINKKKDLLRIYVVSHQWIHKKYIYQLERQIEEQLFSNVPLRVKIIERFYLSRQYTPENFLEVYRPSILLELKNHSVFLNHLFSTAEITFPETNKMHLVLVDSVVAKEREEELVHILEKIFCERCGFDGGVADSIPIIRSLKTGHRKNVIILTRNFGYRKKEGTRGWELYVAAFRKYPNLVRALVNRAKHYNQVLECIEKWEEEGSVFVIRPEIPAVSRLEKDEERLREFYQHGYDQMKANFEALQEFLKEE